MTGATGQVGGALVRLLAIESDLQVIAAVRSPEKAAALGVPVVLLDYDREETLAPALEDIDSVFMVTGYTVDMLKQSKSFINAAKRAGSESGCGITPTRTATATALAIRPPFSSASTQRG